MPASLQGSTKAATLNKLFWQARKVAAAVSLCGLFICCGGGSSYAGLKVDSNYYAAFGNAADVAVVAKTGDVLGRADLLLRGRANRILGQRYLRQAKQAGNQGDDAGGAVDVLVGLSSYASLPAGIQIFRSSQGYGNPCSDQNIINFEALKIGIKQVEGLQIFPDRYRQVRLTKVSVGAAVEQLGAEFIDVDLSTCDINSAVNVAQPPVQPPQDCDKPNENCAPGTFNLAVTSKLAGLVEYAFVANEYGLPLNYNLLPLNSAVQKGSVGIVRVQRDFYGRFTTRTRRIFDYIQVPGANTIPGTTISHNGKYLYVVNEGTADGTYPQGSRYYGHAYNNPTGGANEDLATDSCVNRYGALNQNGEFNEDKTGNGVLTIIDVDKAIRGWGQASIVQTIAAGCSPVRVVESADGQYVFVATRGGNPANTDSSGNPVPTEPPAGSVGRILVFNISSLIADPNNALVNVINSGGTQPVGMTLFNFNNVQQLAVANSNRYNQTGKTGITSVAIFGASNPESVREPEVVCLSANPYVFPRGVTSSVASGTVYVANFGKNISGQNFGGALQVMTLAEDPTSDATSDPTSRCQVGPYPNAPN
jgi:hypothetical protein